MVGIVLQSNPEWPEVQGQVIKMAPQLLKLVQGILLAARKIIQHSVGVFRTLQQLQRLPPSGLRYRQTQNSNMLFPVAVWYHSTEYLNIQG